MTLVLGLAGCLPMALVRATSPAEPPITPLPPLTPRWAYEPWAWEDEENTAEAVRDLVEGYREHRIPLGAVIIDSPWATNYNTFDFGPNYPNAAGLIRELRAERIRVLLWVTGFVNASSIDGPDRGKAALYDEALAAGYFVDHGRVYKWGKGRGSAIDFFNPEAVAWWYTQMDRAFALGVAGWKVDNAESSLPEELETVAGRRTLGEYREAYYRAMYGYVVSRDPEAIVTARPYAFESTDAARENGVLPDRATLASARMNNGGVVYAPIDANPAGWVGDQSPDWAGLEEALDNILASAERGYAVVGSDIGGYLPGRRNGKLFMRWTQLGALSPLMENGGRGEHRPWKLGPDVLESYRYYAKLHHELVPYLYSAGVEAHRTGRPIIRNPDRAARQYHLGEDLLVAPIVAPQDGRDVLLPPGRWHDYWDDDRALDGPTVVHHTGPAERVPLFIRAGAIIPMQVDDAETGHGGAGSRGRLTLLIYPDGESARTYHPDAEQTVPLRSRREAGAVSVELGPQTEAYVLRIKETAIPDAVMLERNGSQTRLPSLGSWETFDGADEGWYYDAERRYVWARLTTQDSGARLTYTTRSPDG